MSASSIADEYYRAGYDDGQEYELRVLEQWIERLRKDQAACSEGQTPEETPRPVSYIGMLDWCIRGLEQHVRSRRQAR